MSKVEFHHLYKRYDNAEKDTLKDINFKIEDKQFIAVVGPSGCGKSTLLQCFSGLEKISKGEIWVDGKRFDNVPPQKRGIAMVFQDYALYPQMTVYKNLAFNLKLSKIPKAEIDQRIKAATDKLKLTEFLKRKPAQLSGGQRQRVALGRAMVRDPEIFLMDEPLSNLDAKLRVQTRQDIVELHKQLGTVTVYVTHDQAEAMAMADKILIMKDGVIQQFDSPEELYDNPCNLFVARFIGSPSMNIFKGTLSSKGIFSVNKVDYDLSKIIDPAILPQNTRKIILGFRPEKIHNIDFPNNDSKNEIENNSDFSFIATKEYAEYLGSNTLVYLKVNGAKMVVQTNKRIKAGPSTRVLKLHVLPDNLYFFDAESGRNLQYAKGKNKTN